jgi:hypothetical protein
MRRPRTGWHWAPQARPRSAASAIQRRHFDDVLAGSLELAAAEDPVTRSPTDARHAQSRPRRRRSNGERPGGAMGRRPGEGWSARPRRASGLRAAERPSTGVEPSARRSPDAVVPLRVFWLVRSPIASEQPSNVRLDPCLSLGFALRDGHRDLLYVRQRLLRERGLPRPRGGAFGAERDLDRPVLLPEDLVGAAAAKVAPDAACVGQFHVLPQWLRAELLKRRRRRARGRR